MLDRDHKFGAVICDGVIMELWDRPNDPHGLGILNGCPDTWYLRKTNRYDATFEWVPWIDKCVKRPCWRLEFSEENHSKFKWDEWRVSGSVKCRMYINDQQVYSFTSLDLSFAMARAQVLQVELLETVPALDYIVQGKPFEPRKVWYKGHPAVVTALTECGEARLEPDGSVHPNMLEPHMTEDWEKEWAEEWETAVFVFDDILSPRIYWYRD